MSEMPLEGYQGGRFTDRVRATRALHEHKKEKADPAWKDSELLAPSSDWDRADRLGLVGTGARLFLVPGSKRYQDRYDEIDWEDE